MSDEGDRVVVGSWTEKMRSKGEWEEMLE